MNCAIRESKTALVKCLFCRREMVGLSMPTMPGCSECFGFVAPA